MMEKVKKYPEYYRYIKQEDISDIGEYTEHLKLGYTLALLSAWAAYQADLGRDLKSYEG